MQHIDPQNDRLAVHPQKSMSTECSYSYSRGAPLCNCCDLADTTRFLAALASRVAGHPSTSAAHQPCSEPPAGRFPSGVQLNVAHGNGSGSVAAYGVVHLRASLAVRVTVETPSMNLVRKMTLALLNMPSFSDTTMNWEKGKCVLIMCPMFCVWLRSNAASTCRARPRALSPVGTTTLQNSSELRHELKIITEESA